MHYIGLVYFGQEKYDQALKHYKDSLDITKSISPLDYSMLTITMTNIGCDIEQFFEKVVFENVLIYPVKIEKQNLIKTVQIIYDQHSLSDY